MDRPPNRMPLPQAETLPWLMIAAPYLLDRDSFFGTAVDWPAILWVVQNPYWGLVLACLLTALFFRKPRQAGGKLLLALDAASGAAMALGVLLSQALVLGPNPVIAILGLTLCGAGVAWQYARWGQCCARIGLRRTIAIVCWAFILAELFKCLYYLLPAARPVGNVAMAVLGTVALRKCLADSVKGHPKAPAKDAETLKLRDYWLVPVAIVLISATVGVMLTSRYTTFGSSSGLQILLGNAVEIVAVVLAWYWICVRKGSLSVVGILAAMAAVMATSNMLLATLGRDAASVAYLLTSIDYGLLNLFVWIILANICERSDAEPGAVFALGMLVRSAPILLASVLSKITGLTLEPATCAILMYVACMTLVTVLFGRNVSISKFFSDLNAQAPADQTGLAPKCREITAAYHLTSREAEVLELIASGKSRPYIAEALSISENTVRVYTAKIYGKLDVHDRGALFAMVYGAPDGPEAEL